MSQSTNIRIAEFTEDKVIHPTPSLGDVATEAQLAMVQWKLGNRCKRKFALSWTGSKVPRGVTILGHEIVWTQHGRVIAKDAAGKDVDIGIYQRVIEWGGPNQDSHTLYIGVFDHISEGSSPTPPA